MLHAFVGRWIAWLQLPDAVDKDIQSYSFSFSRSLYVSLLHLFQLSYVIFYIYSLQWWHIFMLADCIVFYGCSCLLSFFLECLISKCSVYILVDTALAKLVQVRCILYKLQSQPYSDIHLCIVQHGQRKLSIVDWKTNPWLRRL
jgi:hypothetical protein